MNRHTRTIFVSICLLVALVLSASRHVKVDAQKPISHITSRPFEPSEELLFEAEFSRALLRRVDVAEFRFTASRTPLYDPSKSANGQIQDQPYTLTFNADITSKGFFTRLFNLKFRERVESTVEPFSFTVQKTKILDEQGKRVRSSEAIFDQRKGKVSWTQHDPSDPGREPRNIITNFDGQLQDVLSAIYFIRTKPLEVGKSFEMFVGDSGRVYRVPVRVAEKKRMNTILGRVSVLRVEPLLFGPDRMIDQEKGEFSIYITDDNRHIPVGGRVKLDYGTFDIKLKKIVSTLSR